MDEITKRKVKAAAQMAFGALRIGGGVMTATGHGTVGALLKHRHMHHVALRLGKQGVEAGMDHIRQGWDAWKRA